METSKTTKNKIIFANTKMIKQKGKKMSRTKKFVKLAKQEIKHRPSYSKSEQIDSKAKLQTKMIATHRSNSR